MADASAAPSRLTAVQLPAIARELDAFAAAVPGVRSAVVASIDGFALAETAGVGGNGERLAAMTSSMLGLAKAVSHELALGAMEALLIEAGDGKVLMLSMPTAPAPLLLMAACNQGTVIGSMLWNARQCSRRIQAVCSAPP